MGPIKRAGLVLIALSGAAAIALVFAVAAAAAIQGVTIVTPVANATVSNTTTITAVCDSGSINRTISSVKYRIDNGALIDMSGPNGSAAGTWTVNWDSTAVANGSHTITCRENLSSGGNVSSAAMTVNVSNGTITITIPTTSTLAVSMDATVTTAVVVKVKSTVPWGMTVQADHLLQATATRTIPTQRLVFTSSTDGTSGSVVSVAKQFSVGSPTSVITTCAATPLGGNNITALYYLRVTDDDLPGVYGALHTYTVTGN